jgi:phospholipase D-like protein
MPIFGGFGLLLLALWIFCIVDVIVSDENEVRNLPKLVWLMIVLLLPDIGSIVWLVAGRPVRAEAPRRPSQSRFPEYDRPGRQPAGNPDDDEEFLRRCRERAEQQRQAAKPKPRPDDES